MAAADWPAERRIHVAGIETENATFETEPPTWDPFVRGRSVVRLVAVDAEGVVLGWSAAGRVRSRR
jgi:phosphinothricin acetyltransferase